jgi:hypothetical protein
MTTTFKAGLFVVVCLLAAQTASAQTWKPSAVAARPQPLRQRYASYSNPPVSPYVNLGVNSNGISNYQTFVRPLIEERRAIEQQSAAIEQLNERTRPAASGRTRREIAGRGPDYRPAVRFMDYSHYFGGVQ